MSGPAVDTAAERRYADDLERDGQSGGTTIRALADALDAVRAEVARGHAYDAERTGYRIRAEAAEAELAIARATAYQVADVMTGEADVLRAEVARLRAAMPDAGLLAGMADFFDGVSCPPEAKLCRRWAARIRSALDATNKPVNKERIDMHEWTKNQPTERGWQRRWVVIQRKGRAPHPRIATVKNEPPAPLRVSLQGYPTLSEDDILLYGPLAPVQSVPPGWEEALDAHPVVPGEPRS